MEIYFWGDGKRQIPHWGTNFLNSLRKTSSQMYGIYSTDMSEQTSSFPRTMKMLVRAYVVCMVCIPLFDKILHTRQEEYKLCRNIKNKNPHTYIKSKGRFQLNHSSLDNTVWYPLFPEQWGPCSGWCERGRNASLVCVWVDGMERTQVTVRSGVGSISRVSVIQPCGC